jgi:hypothetical protein
LKLPLSKNKHTANKIAQTGPKYKGHFPVSMALVQYHLIGLFKNAASNYVAVASGVDSSSATVYWSSGDGNGIYHVLVHTGTEAKYQNNVTF